jgi:hypothetical protein
MREMAGEVFLTLCTVCIAQNLCSELFFSRFNSFYAGVQRSGFRTQCSFNECDDQRLFRQSTFFSHYVLYLLLRIYALSFFFYVLTHFTLEFTVLHSEHNAYSMNVTVGAYFGDPRPYRRRTRS